MILYFTGTGNSAFIAKRIAEKTGDTAVDVFPMIRENDYGKLSSSRPFVVVCPTYGWQIPHVLGNWLKKTRLSGSRKLYFVMTCGDGIGNAGGYAKRFCEKKGMEYMGCGKVVMPENYVAMFPVPDRTEAEHQKRESASEGRDLASGPVPQHRGESCVLQAVRPCGKIQDHGKVYRLRGLCKALSPVQYPSGGREPCVGIRLYPLYGLHLPVSGTGHRIRKGQSGKTQIPMSGSRGGK